ncbi:MAG: hypothetical protein EU532_09830 [Promethearchaeota archaeon]|nr:MAG: hypothetical protein EU532_09830 [Candidatus Lokiarchaeota archaeon]
MSYKIIVDLSHNEQIEEFPEFSLGEDDFDVDYIDKNEVLTFESLEDFDILFIGNIKHTKSSKKDKFTPEQLKDIKKFVGEGGGLLLTSGAGGDQDIPMKEGSIRVLYKLTGVKKFWNGKILETSSNFLVNKENLLINELFSHPITKGITELVFPECTFFSLTEEEVEDLIVTSEKAEFKYFNDDDVDEVGSVPICVVSEFFNGRCATFGSSEWMIEDSDFGIDAGDNLKFLENIIKWLSFEI